MTSIDNFRFVPRSGWTYKLLRKDAADWLDIFMCYLRHLEILENVNDKLAQRSAVALLTRDQRVASSRLTGVAVFSVVSLSKTLCLYLLRSTV